MLSKMRVIFTKTFSVFLSTVSISLCSMSAFASIGGDTADLAKVVSLKVADLKMIEHRNGNNYSFAAVKDGRMVAIPSQFDEHTESGFIYMKNAPKKNKKKDPIVGKEMFFDGDDEFIFMLKDAGPRKNKNMLADGKLIAEVELDTYKGKKRYVYVVEDARIEAEDYYVRYSSDMGRVESDYYSLKVDPKNAFMWEDFYYENFKGQDPGRPIDTLKLRMKSNVLAAVPLTLNNKHMIARLVDEKSGPIRSTSEYKVTLTYLKSPVMNFNLQIVHHEQDFTYDSRVNVPAIRRRLVAKSTMTVAIDGNNLMGAEVRTINGPKTPGIVDGGISSIEDEMLASNFQNGEENWYFIDSKAGFTALVDFYLLAENEDLPLSVIYEEDSDREMKPEYYKGQLPILGFKLNKVPLKGDMRVIANYRMFDQEIDIDASDFANLVLRKPLIKVKAY